MKIYLIRHGESISDIEDRYGGDYDDSLTEKGISQVRILADKLKDKEIEIMFHSPKKRAAETAHIVGQSLKVKLKLIENLRERNNYGILTGLTKSEAKQKYPEEVEKLEKECIDHTVKNSENYKNFKKRILDVFNKITNDYAYSTIGIVTHGGPIKCIVREILHLGELKKLVDCAFLEIDYNQKDYTIRRVDGVEFKNEAYSSR